VTLKLAFASSPFLAMNLEKLKALHLQGCCHLRSLPLEDAHTKVVPPSCSLVVVLF
jgi:hypothetical protein